MYYNSKIVQPKNYKNIIEQSNYVKRLKINNSVFILSIILLLIESLSIALPNLLFVYFILVIGLLIFVISNKLSKKLTTFELNKTKQYTIINRLSTIAIFIIFILLISISFI